MTENDKPRVGDVYRLEGTVVHGSPPDDEYLYLNCAGVGCITAHLSVLTPDKRIRRKEIEVGDRVHAADLDGDVLVIDGNFAGVRWSTGHRTFWHIDRLTLVPSDE